MYLFFDTETTGLPNDWDAPLSDTNNWPRLVQLAWSMVSKTGQTIKEKSVIIRPEGFKIPDGMIHGISNSEAIAKGQAIMPTVLEFINDVKASSVIVAHNFSFDHSIVGCEIIRLRLEDGTDFLNRKFDWYCTMKDQRVKNFCRLPPFKYGSYKQPKLSELYSCVIGGTFDFQHNALNDMQATKESFFKLRQMEIL